MSWILRKGIDITPNGVIRPGSLQDYRSYRAQPWFGDLLATTSHVRMWADWPSLQPEPDLPLGDPRGSGYWRVQAMDEQIRLANADGLRVILVPYRYPRWVNGTEGLADESDEYLLYKPQDRVSADTWFDWYDARGTADEPARRLRLRNSMRALEYELPAEGHGPASHWGRWVAALMDRYVDHADEFGRVAFFETTNEPNHQLWPQRSPSARADDLEGRFDLEGSVLTSPDAIAEMMTTLDGLARRRRPVVKLLGPSTSDADSTRPRLITIHANTPYSQQPDPWVPALLYALDRRGFRGGEHWTWSFHNYNDFEMNETRVPYVRALLRGRWRGALLDGGPMLVATEGGARISRMRTRFGLPGDTPAEQLYALQSQVIAECFTRHHRPVAEGAGVRMLTYYTVDADPNFDCGLREPGGDPRPAYATWCGLVERRMSRGAAQGGAR